MGLIINFVVTATALFTVFLGYRMTLILQPKPVQQLQELYWGPGVPKPDDVSIRKFKIHASNETLEDLRDRLQRTKRPIQALEGIQFQYGFHSGTLEKVLDFWLNKYNWKEQEQFLNSIPQYKTTIQGLNIHYLHAKPSGKLPTRPLLLLHGWPGSVREFYKIIPLLTTPTKGSKYVFEVIAPSLPGYGFSDSAVRPGLSPSHAGVILKNLMKRLGHEKFYIHGGDWGAIVGEGIASRFPENVMGLHSTMCIAETPMAFLKNFVGSIFPKLVVDDKNVARMYPLSTKFLYLLEEMGYLHLQATRPDTVGMALTDSPAGLATYIIEKFSAWTNKEFKSKTDGGLPGPFTYNELLDNVMIYWLSNSITSSMRFYAEHFSHAGREISTTTSLTTVPTACARFKYELAYTSDALLSEKFVDLIQTNDFDVGGHFAAFEVPELVAKDLRDAVSKIESRAPHASPTK